MFALKPYALGRDMEFFKRGRFRGSSRETIKNAAPHGAPFNHDTALKAACEEWIKILEDDDVLKPNCLDVLANIVKERRDVAAVSCACETFVDGKLVAPFYRRDRGLLEEIGPNDALLAM
jgi:hypothetical protein